jgi:hypothetical protein
MLTEITIVKRAYSMQHAIETLHVNLTSWTEKPRVCAPRYHCEIVQRSIRSTKGVKHLILDTRCAITVTVTVIRLLMALPTNGRVIIETTAGEVDIELWSKVPSFFDQPKRLI